MILLALLPIPPKFTKQTAAQTDAQRERNRHILHSVLEQVLQPMCSAGEEGVEMSCSDGKVRRCFPILTAWLADHEEHVTLHNIARNRCPRCEVSSENPGELQEFPLRNHSIYQQKIAQYNCTGDLSTITDLAFVGLKSLYNGLWTLPRIEISDIPKPDLLHTIYLGLMKNLLEWITAFLGQHNRLDAFDDIWRSMPPYPGFTPPRKAFREVSQWQGKEMRAFGIIVLAALAVALSKPTPSQRLIFNSALRCTRNLVDFHLMAQYQSHTAETLKYLDDYLKGFHKEKEVFLAFRQSKSSKKKADAWDKKLQTQYAQEDASDPLHRGSKTRQKKQRLDEIRKNERNIQRQEIMESDTHFNYPKMHLLTHFHEHVIRFGNLPMYSTEIGEYSHRTQIKEGYRHSNRNDYINQILGYYGRQQAMHTRQENLRALSHHKLAQNSDLRAILALPANATPQERILRHLRAREHGGHVVEDVQRRLSRFIQGLDLCQLLVTYSLLNVPIEHQIPSNKDQLLNLPAELFNQLEVPVPSFNNYRERDIHHIRCVDSFRHQGGRHDWVWVKAGDETQFGALRGRLPGQVEVFFKIRDINTEYSHRLANVRTLRPGPDGGFPDPYHGLVTVRRGRGRPGSDFTVVNISSICGMAHIVPVFPSKESECETWLVNSRIDLSTFNNIY